MPDRQKIEVNAAYAVLNAAEDAFLFLLQPETMPVFYAWMCQRGRVKPGFTAEMMAEDLTTIAMALPEVRGA